MHRQRFAVHRGVDVGIGGSWLLVSRQMSGLHDLAGLAVAALGTCSSIQAVCSGWAPAGSSPSIVVDRNAGRRALSGVTQAAQTAFAVEMNGAGAAHGDCPQPKLGPGQAQFVAQDPTAKGAIVGLWAWISRPLSLNVVTDPPL